MPIYEYQCGSCQHVFEVITPSGSTGEKVQCSKCGSDKVSKMISAGSFRRGTGHSLPCAGPGAGPSGCGKKRSGFS